MLIFTCFIAAWLTVDSGKSEQASFKGCFSSSFVQQYASYYRIKHSISIESCFAACNNRMTKYIGLQIDKSDPTYNFVYCGNDLLEVSRNVGDSACHPCQDKPSLYCGDDGFMAVYLLRDSIPLAVLLATNRGVEMLVDNTTTLRVTHEDYKNVKYVDYIYTEDMIISVVGENLLRSFYIPLTMIYTVNYIIKSYIYSLWSLAVDHTQNTAYYGYYGNYGLYKLNLTSLQWDFINKFTNVPMDISVDPYDRFLMFLTYSSGFVHIFNLDGHRVFEDTLVKFHVDYINALTMDVQEKLLYAILQLKSGNTTYLVSLDYGLSKMRVLFSGPEVEHVTAIEVFNGDVVWLRNVNDNSYIYKCKLTPRCSLQNLTIYKSFMKIYDISIYHPEKQTPGKKRLCADMSCVHGCELFSPFTARCSCPPGMNMAPDNETCYDQTFTIKPEYTATLSPSSEDQEETSNTPISSTLTSSKDFPSENNSVDDYDVSNNNQAENKNVDNYKVTKHIPSENNNVDDLITLLKIVAAFIVFPNIILFVLIVLIIVAMYKMNTKVTRVLEPSCELNELL